MFDKMKFEPGEIIIPIIQRNEIKEVIYNPPRTIINWQNGDKTVVKCRDEDEYDYELGFLYCLAKRFLGDKFHRTMREHCWENQECILVKPEIKTHSLSEFDRLLP